MGRVALVVQRPRRHDGPLLRRLDAVGRRRAAARRPRDDRPERRPGVHVPAPVPGRRALLPAVGRPDRGLRADRASSASSRAATTSATRMEDTGCGLPNSAAVAGEDQLSGRYSRLAPRARLTRTAPRRPRSRSSPCTASTTTPRACRRSTGSPAAAGAPATSCGSASGTTAPAAARPGAASSGPTRCTPGSTSSSRSATVNTGPPVELFMSDGTLPGRAHGRPHRGADDHDVAGRRRSA